MKIIITILVCFLSLQVGAQDEDPLAIAGEVACECINKIEATEAATFEEETSDCLRAGSLAYQLAGVSSKLKIEDEKETESSEKTKEVTITVSDTNPDIDQYLFENCPIFAAKFTRSFDVEVVAVQNASCTCVEGISTSLPLETKNQQIEECISTSYQNHFTEKNQFPTTDAEINTFVQKVQTALVNNCDAIATVTFADDEEKLNSYSYNEKAMEAYNKGQNAYKAGDLKEAIKHYKKALSIDAEFVFAWDNLGRTYRELNKLDKAIEAYEKSLAIDMHNRTALMNMAVAYSHKKDFPNVIKYYKQLKEYYPEDPESAYGLALSYYNTGEYNDALTNAIEAYKLYKKSNSPYFADAEKVIKLLYKAFESEDRVEEFKKICADNDVNLQF